MPKLSVFRQYHYDATVKVSENTRALSLSAIGIIWLSKKDIGGNYQVPMELITPLLLVVSAMALDFAQYVYRSVIWHYIFRKEEERLNKNEITEESELYVKTRVNTVAYIFFYTKVIVLTASYYLLLSYFVKSISWK